MDVLVCVKRVPETGARITLTADEQSIDTTYLGFTISPHEECAVEEALRIGGDDDRADARAGRPRSSSCRTRWRWGSSSAVLLETDGDDWGPEATAAAIADARARRRSFDLLLFGNESADNGNYQVAIRVAAALGLPWVTGIKGIEIADGVVRARREAGGGWEVFELPLPAVVERARGDQPAALPVAARAGCARRRRRSSGSTPERRADGLEKVRLVVPQEAGEDGRDPRRRARRRRRGSRSCCASSGCGVVNLVFVEPGQEELSLQAVAAARQLGGPVEAVTFGASEEYAPEAWAQAIADAASGRVGRAGRGDRPRLGAARARGGEARRAAGGELRARSSPAIPDGHAPALGRQPARGGARLRAGQVPDGDAARRSRADENDPRSS